MDEATPRVDYRTDPSRYRHWKLAFDGPIATLSMDVAEDGGLRPGYKLKLNSYDLGVDIELADALNRIRFEHPETRTVVLTSAKDRIFCSGANIFMLGASGHAWKVNFCKFTNETRNGIEDSSRHSGLRFVAAVNGTCAGGGYELALACDEIILVDDRSSAVSLPEVPLLGVLPGTGGLTRITDKRHVRHDHADIFCTTAEGVRGQRALDWKLVDAIVKPAQFAAAVRARALALAESGRLPDSKPVKLTPLERTIGADAIGYENVSIAIDRARRLATFTVRAPAAAQPGDVAAIEALGAAWWPLAVARELDDAILTMRTNELDIGTWILKTEGDAANVLACDAALEAHAENGFVREVVGAIRRTLAHGSTFPPARSTRSSSRARASRGRSPSSRSRPTAATCWPRTTRRARPPSRSPRSTSVPTRWSTASRASRGASTTTPARSRPHARRQDGPSMPRRRSRSGW